MLESRSSYGYYGWRGGATGEEPPKPYRGGYHYQNWLIKITTESGTDVWEFKAKSKEHVIRQIKREQRFRDSEKNLNQPWFYRQPRILSINWDSLTQA